ncbi:hypothetical protein [Streptomyces huasconensis]
MVTLENIGGEWKIRSGVDDLVKALRNLAAEAAGTSGAPLSSTL